MIDPVTELCGVLLQKRCADQEVGGLFFMAKDDYVWMALPDNPSLANILATIMIERPSAKKAIEEALRLYNDVLENPNYPDPAPIP
jgi:hypothetical protein